MYPELFHIPYLYTYGVLLAVGLLSALWLVRHLAKCEGLNHDSVSNLGIYCALSAIGGAKTMMYLVDFQF